MGASQGIGLGIAGALAREGARIGMASRSLERLEITRPAIEGETATFAADTDDPERLAALPGEVAERFGAPVEILVTNTGRAAARRGAGALNRGVGGRRTGHWCSHRGALIEGVLPEMRSRGWGGS